MARMTLEDVQGLVQQDPAAWLRRLATISPEKLKDPAVAQQVDQARAALNQMVQVQAAPQGPLGLGAAQGQPPQAAAQPGGSQGTNQAIPLGAGDPYTLWQQIGNAAGRAGQSLPAPIREAAYGIGNVAGSVGKVAEGGYNALFASQGDEPNLMTKLGLAAASFGAGFQNPNAPNPALAYYGNLENQRQGRAKLEESAAQRKETTAHRQMLEANAAAKVHQDERKAAIEYSKHMFPKVAAAKRSGDVAALSAYRKEIEDNFGATFGTKLFRHAMNRPDQFKAVMDLLDKGDLPGAMAQHASLAEDANGIDAMFKNPKLLDKYIWLQAQAGKIKLDPKFQQSLDQEFGTAPKLATTAAPGTPEEIIAQGHATEAIVKAGAIGEKTNLELRIARRTLDDKDFHEYTTLFHQASRDAGAGGTTIETGVGGEARIAFGGKEPDPKSLAKHLLIQSKHGATSPEVARRLQDAAYEYDPALKPTASTKGTTSATPSLKDILAEEKKKAGIK